MSGPGVVLTLAALSVVGATCAAAGMEQNRMATTILSASFRSSLFIDRPPVESPKLIFRRQDDERGMEAPGGPHASIFPLPFSGLHYGIGFGLGRGATPQISGARGGSGGVGL